MNSRLSINSSPTDLTIRSPDHFNQHRGYQRLLSGDRMTVGIELPLSADRSPEGESRRLAEKRLFGVPDMSEHARLAQLADEYGYSCLWLRDIPLYHARFGDAGQVFDPFVYLGYLAAITKDIAIGTAAVILPLRHPLLVAKATASVDQLSDSRFICGIATGDRPIEFPLFDVDFNKRGELLQEAIQILKSAWVQSGISFGKDMIHSIDVLPKPSGSIPLMMAGRGQQSLEWIAHNLDGWINYPPRNVADAKSTIDEWRTLTNISRDGAYKPFITMYLVDLEDNPSSPPKPFRFGATLGRNHLISHMNALADAGVNHLALNFRHSRRPIDEVMQEIAEIVLPLFSSPVVPKTRSKHL